MRTALPSSCCHLNCQLACSAPGCISFLRPLLQVLVKQGSRFSLLVVVQILLDLGAAYGALVAGGFARQRLGPCFTCWAMGLVLQPLRTCRHVQPHSCAGTPFSHPQATFWARLRSKAAVCWQLPSRPFPTSSVATLQLEVGDMRCRKLRCVGRWVQG